MICRARSDAHSIAAEALRARLANFEDREKEVGISREQAWQQVDHCREPSDRMRIDAQWISHLVAYLLSPLGTRRLLLSFSAALANGIT